MLNSQLFLNVYLKLPYEDVVRHTIVSKKFNILLNDPVFWKKMVYRDFGDIAGDLCGEGDWKHYYEICYKIEPISIHNIRFWGEKDKWGKKKYDPTEFFRRTILDENPRRFELYFKFGCNQVVEDEEYMRLVRWLCNCPNPKIVFREWFERLVNNIEFSSSACWQHTANDVLITLVNEENCDIKENKPNINDVVALTKKSKKPPLAFLYKTLGSSQNLTLYTGFSQAFPEVGECLVIFPDRIRMHHRVLKLDCYFFSGMAKSNNKRLLEQYLKKYALDSYREINIRGAFHMILGCIENDKLEFLQHLKERLPSTVTPETILRLCKLFVAPPVRIINFGLCCSLSEGKMSWDSIQDSISCLMDVILKSYSLIHLESRMRPKLEAGISLLLNWGYDDYLRIIRITKRITNVFYERLRGYLSPEELISIELC